MINMTNLERAARYQAAAGYLHNLAEADSLAGDLTHDTWEEALQAATEWANDTWPAYADYSKTIRTYLQ